MTKAEIQIFADHCVFMWSIYRHLQTLYEQSNESDHARMRRTAEIFFGDLRQVLVEYVTLQACKVTDPIASNGNNNHTVRFLITEYGLSHDAKIMELDKRLDEFRRKVLPARNKLISHSDRDTILAGKPLGGASNAAWNQFWTDLSDLVSLIHEKVCGEPFRITDVGMATDVEGLLQALEFVSNFEDANHP